MAISAPSSLVFDVTTLAVADGSDRYLELCNPRPGTGTEEQLERLAHAAVPV